MPIDPLKFKSSMYGSNTTRRYIETTRKDNTINTRALSPTYIPALMNQYKVISDFPMPISPYVVADYVEPGYVINTV